MHVTEALGGGVQNAISKYTHILTTANHLVVGRPREGEDSGEFTEATKVLKFEGGIIEYLLRVRGLVLEEEPDIVHLHSSLAGLARLVLPPGLAIAYSPHCYAFERLDKNRLWRSALWAVEWILARRKQSLVAVSPHEAELGRKLNSKMPVHYVPNVFISEASPPLNHGALTVCMVGRIGLQKDPSLFAAVARELGGKFPFLWIGDGDPQLRKELADSGVAVTGWVTPSEARGLVRESALYLHTGAWEAAPIATMEAAASGVPVIARAIPTMKSLGYVTAPDTVPELAAAVQSFFEDAKVRESMNRQTRSVVESLSPDRALRAICNAYDATTKLVTS